MGQDRQGLAEESRLTIPNPTPEGVRPFPRRELVSPPSSIQEETTMSDQMLTTLQAALQQLASQQTAATLGDLGRRG